MASWHIVPGTSWTLGELKSALQKFVRRRDPHAISVADILLGAGGEARTALLRRLPIIAAEEGMLGVIPAATDVALATNGSPEVVDELARIVVRALLATTRDKDPTCLFEFAQLHGPEGLGAVEREAYEVASSWSIPRARGVLVECERTVRTPLAREIIAALRRRAAARMGDGEWPIFVGIALALRARERADVEPVVLPVGIAEPALAGPMDVLPWWALDPHVAIGQAVLREAIARWPGVTFERGFAIWFQLVSDVLEGYVPREGWRERYAALNVTEADRAWWAKVEPFVRARLEEMIARRVARRPVAVDSRPPVRATTASVNEIPITDPDGRIEELRAAVRHAGAR